jgi:SM-20-related protein
MTAKQILDSFSTTLMLDERILSARERILLANLLQHAKAAADEDQGTQAAVQKVIAAAVGETVAQRAFSILGGSIVERILEGSASLGESAGTRSAEIHAGGPPATPPPRPPNPGHPQPPGRDRASEVARSAETEFEIHAGGPPPTPPPRPPNPGQPQPPGRDRATVIAGSAETEIGRSAVAVAEPPVILPAQCVVLDEFLAPQELEELIRFTLEREDRFIASEVVSPTEESGEVNYDHRRSRVLMDLGQHQDSIVDRIRRVLPEVLGKLGMEEFQIAQVEAQITSSNDGDFFRFHSDNGSEQVAGRSLTFVYFFHREPQQFEGGELRIHDARLKGDGYESEGSFQAIVPRQNQIVFFPCELMHEVTTVRCPSRLFADSRFTLNGWLRH